MTLKAPGRCSATSSARPPGPRADEALRAVGAGGDVLGAPVGVRGADGDGARADQATPPRGVDAHHLARGAPVEQARLGGEVVLHVGVEVEVLRGEVGERPDREARAGHPAEREGVAGDLHGHVRRAALHHRGEQRLQVGRLGGREGAGQASPAQAGLDGADQPRARPGRGERGLEQVDGGGLAAGAGHAEDTELRRRVAVDPRRRVAERRARVGVHEHRDPGVPQRRTRGAVGVGEHRGGTPGQGVGGEVGAVRPRPGEGAEQVAGADLVGPQRRSGDLRRRRPADLRRSGVGQRLDEARGEVGDPDRDHPHRPHRPVRRRSPRGAGGVVSGPGGRGGHGREGYSPSRSQLRRVQATTASRRGGCGRRTAHAGRRTRSSRAVLSPFRRLLAGMSRGTPHTSQ